MIKKEINLSKNEKKIRILEERLEQFNTLIEQSPDGVFSCDLNGKFVAINNATIKITGYTKSELLNMNIWDIVPKKYKKQYKERLSLILKGDVLTEPKIYEIRRKDEINRILEIRSAPLIKNKKVIGFQGLAKDVTEKKKSEKALIEKDREYTTLVENLNVGVYRNTPGEKGKFIEANPAIIKMFGYPTKKSFLKLDVSNLYQNPKDRKKLNEKMLKYGFVKGEELQLKKKSGKPFWASVTATVVRDEKGNVKHYDGIIEDITKRKEIEDDLRHAYDEVARALEQEKEFKLETAHYFFNPICIAKGFLQLALEDGDLARINAALHAIERVENVIKNIVKMGEIKE